MMRGPWLRSVPLATFVATLPCATSARVERAFDDDEILAPKTRDAEPKLKSMQTRVTAYFQQGQGYQSQAGPVDDAGSEQLQVWQAQSELVLQPNEAITHRLWVPVDVVSSASADAIDRHYSHPDVVSSASATNFSLEADYRLGLQVGRDETYSTGVAVHVEEPFNSWALALGYQRTLADDNATFELNVTEVFDWFHEFEVGGARVGRASRSTTNISLSLSQLLSPSTAIAVAGDMSLQHGELGNTWNTVPLEGGGRGLELLPPSRLRCASSVRLAQWLPWDAALSLQYRFYRDTWEVTAHSAEVILRQRLLRWLTIAASYRHHRQSGVYFFTRRSITAIGHRSADSDLAELSAQTLGGTLTLALSRPASGSIFFDLGYDHYFRSDELTVEVATWATGIRF
jgi:hypothetical protein